MAESRAKFVKSASTTTPVINSKRELEKMLVRYGCKGFAVSTNYETGEATINFLVPDHPGKDAVDVPVRFAVKPKVVYDAMYGQPTRYQERNGVWGHYHNPNGYQERYLQQAERVAWRQLILWVDSALSVSASGMAGVAETFLAHTLVKSGDGTIKPMIDHLNDGDGWVKMLPAPGET